MKARDNLRGAFAMGVAMLAFTLSDSGYKLLAPDVPLPQFLALRGAIALALYAVLIRGRIFIWPSETKQRVWILVRSSVELALAFSVLTAVAYIPITDLVAILQTVPLFMTLAAYLIFGERFGWHRGLAIIAGFIGGLMITKPGFAGWSPFHALAVLAMLLIVVRDMISRQFPKTISSGHVAFAAAILVTSVNAIWTWQQGWTPIGTGYVAAIALIAVFVTIGHWFIVSAMRIGEVSFVAGFRYCGILFAVMIDLFIFDDQADMWTLTGCVIISLAGIYTIRRREIRKTPSPESK